MASATGTWHRWRILLGIEFAEISHRERLISALGAGFGIALAYGLTLALVGPGAALLMVAPIGATAVLLFAVPHGALSQPWPVVGGYALSASIGVICAASIPNEAAAAAVAVGLSVAAMYYLRCIHPPGGAIAMMAVLGGDQVRSLGFGFVLVPVMANVAAMLLAAIAFNALFAWRRYPAALCRSQAGETAAEQGYAAISHEDFVYALTQMESFIDVSEEDLLRIYALATGRHPRPEASVVAEES